MSVSYQTPEFLAWTLALSCPVREGADVTSPERTERHLRALRAAGEGIAEGRVIRGVCISRDDGQLGFRVDDALAIYGGLNLAEQHCRECTANVTRSLGISPFAGCYGELPHSTEDGLDWAEIVNEAIERLDLSSEIVERFGTTTPAWYGLWMTRPLASSPLELLGRLWQECLRSVPRASMEAQNFGEAISRASQSALPLYVELHPPGWVDEKGNWLVAASCPRCRAVWKLGSAGCAVCGWKGHHIGERRRKLRGRRPYRPLSEFLSVDEMATISRSDKSPPARE